VCLTSGTLPLLRLLFLRLPPFFTTLHLLLRLTHWRSRLRLLIEPNISHCLPCPLVISEPTPMFPMRGVSRRCETSVTPLERPAQSHPRLSLSHPSEASSPPLSSLSFRFPRRFFGGIFPNAAELCLGLISLFTFFLPCTLDCPFISGRFHGQRSPVLFDPDPDPVETLSTPPYFPPLLCTP